MLVVPELKVFQKFTTEGTKYPSPTPKSIAEKIGTKTHASTKDTLKSTMPYLPVMFRNKEMKSHLIHELELDDEEVEWLEKQIK